jgi:tetratricopeptide (TPR) repeat protein
MRSVCVAVTCVLIAGHSSCPDARAQGFNNWNEFATWCSHTGGHPIPNPPRCIPQPAASAQPPGETEARALNQQGVTAYESSNYVEAEEYFQQAVDKSPDNSIFRENLQKAKDQLKAELDRTNAALANARSAADIRALRLKIESLSSAAKIRALTQESKNEALEQLRVAAGEGKVAEQHLNDRSASDGAQRAFDTGGGVAAPMPIVAGNPAFAPVSIRVQNMPEYKAKVAEKERLQNQLKDLDSRLAENRSKRDKSQTPDQVLITEAAEIKQKIAPIRAQIVVKQIEIDKFVVSMEEESTPLKGKGGKTPTKASVPSPPQQ